MEGGFLSSHAACRVARAITCTISVSRLPQRIGKRFGGNTGGSTKELELHEAHVPRANITVK